jgi:glycerol kinase
VAETTALGAAYLAGLYAGIYKNQEEVASAWSCAKRYIPQMADSQRQTLYDGWRAAIKKVLS